MHNLKFCRPPPAMIYSSPFFLHSIPLVFHFSSFSPFFTFVAHGVLWSHLFCFHLWTWSLAIFRSSFLLYPLIIYINRKMDQNRERCKTEFSKVNCYLSLKPRTQTERSFTPKKAIHLGNIFDKIKKERSSGKKKFLTLYSSHSKRKNLEK